MRRLRWFPLIAVCAGVVVSSDVLLAEQLDEDAVRKTVLTRFDENRNDKLDLGEAKQARARLRNLLEDKSSREINILTWREDIHELLKRFDQDKDNRLATDEVEVAVRTLERIIPKVESEKPEADSSISFGASSNKSSGSGASERDRSQRIRRGSGRGDIYGIGMSGGGFGNSMGYTVGASGSTFNGFGNTFGGVGSTGGVSQGALGSSSYGSGSSSAGRQSGSSGLDTPTTPGTNSLPQSSNGLGPRTDTPSSGTLPAGGGTRPGAFPDTGSASGSGTKPPDGLAGSGGGPARPGPKGGGSSGPTLTPPVAKPNF